MSKIKTLFFTGSDGGFSCRLEVIKALKRGLVAVLPTDTLYGLSCLADKREALLKIKRIKARENNKAFIVLISSLSMLKRYAFLNKEQAEFLKKIWQTDKPPTTVILKHKNNLPSEVSAPFDTLALRLPKSDFLIKIIKRAGVPLVSTSLNLSGQKNLDNLESLEGYFRINPDLAVNAGKAKKRKASRLIDLSRESGPVILRK